jgi:hypothetical protein
MVVRTWLAVIAIVSTLCTTSEFAGQPPGRAKEEKAAKGTTGAQGPSSHAKAYGYYCRNESKKHVAGEKGTPFSRCVTAMAKVGSGKTDSPKAACTGLSKKHTAGGKGTPFSRCVSAASKLLADEQSG